MYVPIYNCLFIKSSVWYSILDILLNQAKLLKWNCFFIKSSVWNSELDFLLNHAKLLKCMEVLLTELLPPGFRSLQRGWAWPQQRTWNCGKYPVPCLCLCDVNCTVCCYCIVTRSERYDGILWLIFAGEDTLWASCL